MAKLSLTTNQTTLVQNLISTPLENSLYSGTEDPGHVEILPKLEGYDDANKMGGMDGPSGAPAKRLQIKQTFTHIFASLLSILNVDTAFPTPVSGVVTITLAPLTGAMGSQGSLTFTNGILTSYVAPT